LGGCFEHREISGQRAENVFGQVFCGGVPHIYCTLIVFYTLARSLCLCRFDLLSRAFARFSAILYLCAIAVYRPQFFVEKTLQIPARALCAVCVLYSRRFFDDKDGIY